MSNPVIAYALCLTGIAIGLLPMTMTRITPMAAFVCGIIAGAFLIVGLALLINWRQFLWS